MRQPQPPAGPDDPAVQAVIRERRGLALENQGPVQARVAVIAGRVAAARFVKSAKSRQAPLPLPGAADSVDPADAHRRLLAELAAQDARRKARYQRRPRMRAAETG